MHEATARNLRTAERFLLAPPLAATFGTSPVAICDISLPSDVSDDVHQERHRCNVCLECIRSVTGSFAQTANQPSIGNDSRSRAGVSRTGVPMNVAPVVPVRSTTT